MTRVAGALLFLAAASAALFLFHIKQEVRELEHELGIAHRNILRHQEAIQVLHTEWSYLNRPARIAELAERHLGMQPLATRQFVGFEQIPHRSAGAAPPAPAQTAPTQTAAGQTAAAKTARAGGGAP
jgi:cell division protein FtsL